MHVSQGSITARGKGYTENQDYSIARAEGDCVLLGVFDGHGEQGNYVSSFAGKTLAERVFRQKDLEGNISKGLSRAFRQTSDQIDKADRFDTFHSGTTAVAALKCKDRLVVANVGDSRCVIGRRGDNGKLKAVDMSTDHDLERKDELARIAKLNGRVHPSMYPVGPRGKLQFMGPPRIWDTQGMHGLAMGRSMGDRHLRPFVTPRADMTEKTLDKKDKVMILASDGVWGLMSSQEAVDIASKHSRPDSAAKEIIKVANVRWHRDTQGQVRDDITAVVASLQTPRTGRAMGDLTARNGAREEIRTSRKAESEARRAVTAAPRRGERLGEQPLRSSKSAPQSSSNRDSGQSPQVHRSTIGNIGQHPQPRRHGNTASGNSSGRTFREFSSSASHSGRSGNDGVHRYDNTYNQNGQGGGSSRREQQHQTTNNQYGQGASRQQRGGHR
jgi:serine/threonine protein phosphatase PrpC